MPVYNLTRLMICRENELLKHQLKKYVGAVQALRSDLHGKSPETAEGKQVSRDSIFFYFFTQKEKIQCGVL